MTAFRSVSIGHWFAALAAALSLISPAARIVPLILFLWLSIDSRPAMSAELFWDGLFGLDASADGEFDVAGHWHDEQGMSAASAPTIGDSAIFDVSDTYTVTFTQNEASDQFIVRAGSVSFLSDSATQRTYDVTSGGADALIRDGGTLNIGSENNPVFVNVSDLMQIGTGTGDGAVTVSGANSRLDVLGAGLSHVGSSGHAGNLTVTASATANFATNGTFRVGISGIATTQGTVTVDGMGILNTGHIEIATVDSGATGTMTVTGGGSSINQTLPGANLTIGSATGGSGMLEIRSGGVFNTGTGTSTVNATGQVNVPAGGRLNARGRLLIDGGSVQQTDSGRLLVSSDTSFLPNFGITVGQGTGAGSMEIVGGGSVTSGLAFLGRHSGSSGSVTVSGADGGGNPSRWITDALRVGFAGSGTLDITGGGRVESTLGIIAGSSSSTGDVTVSGDGSNWTSSGNLVVGGIGTGTLTIEGGGSVSSGDAFIGPNALAIGTAIVSNADPTIIDPIWSVGGSLYLGGTDMQATSGQGTLHVGGDPGGGIVTVGDTLKVWEGGHVNQRTSLIISSNIDAPFISNILAVGVDGGTGRLEITGGIVSGTRGSIGHDEDSTGHAIVSGTGAMWSNSSSLAIGGRGTGTLTIEDGGHVSAGPISIGSGLFGGAGTGAVMLSGEGSTLTTDSSLDVGAADGQGTLTIGPGANVSVGSSLLIRPLGTVNLDGATLRFDGYNRTGTFNYLAGTIQLAGNRSIGSDVAINDLFGIAPTLSVDKNLTIEDTATLETTLTLGGGTFSAESLTMMPGARLTNTQSVDVDMPVLALAGSMIDATGGDLSLGDSADVKGFYSNGTLHVGSNAVTLADANDAVFDSAALVTLGENGSPGTLSAANGLTLDFGADLTGFGTVDTPDNPTQPLINNGHISGNSAAQPLTLTGYLKGVGTLDNVVITGTDAPGFSTATVVRGSVVYDGSLGIEVEGSAAGEFDRIEHILGDGVADLGGALNVLANPDADVAVGDSILFLRAQGGIFNAFDRASLPLLDGGKAFRLFYGETVVGLEVILSGDYNGDGAVDAADYVAWRKNPDAFGGQQGYNDWRANFGRTAASGAAAGSHSSAVKQTTAVPEPVSATLALVAALILAPLSHRALSN